MSFHSTMYYLFISRRGTYLWVFSHLQNVAYRKKRNKNMCRAEDQSILNREIIPNIYYLLAVLVPSFHWLPGGWPSSAHLFLHLFNQWMVIEFLCLSQGLFCASNSVAQKTHSSSPHRVHSLMGKKEITQANKQITEFQCGIS